MSDNIKITLTWAEILLAATVGMIRNIQSLKTERKGGNNVGKADSWTLHIEGAMGECASAKYLDCFWNGEHGDYSAPDVGPYQVKTNTSRRWDDLILKNSDVVKLPDDAIYISVLSFVPDFIICGWITVGEAKQEQWWREGTPGRPAYFVPRAALHSMDDLSKR